MDNICHTLVGAALAESGLKRRTPLGSVTLMIAANLPDVDVMAVPLGHSLGFRRGITHGVPALILLPVALTIVMLAWYRWRGRGVEAPRPVSLLLLSAIRPVDLAGAWCWRVVVAPPPGPPGVPRHIVNAGQGGPGRRRPVHRRDGVPGRHRPEYRA
jgi:hypothetical protein